MTTVISEASDRQKIWTGPVIDCDVHIEVPSLDALAPHLGAQWMEFIRERRYSGPPGLTATYPPGAATTAREEWLPADGRPPGSDLELLRSHVLDPWQVDYAILNCDYAIDSVRYPDFATALAGAINDWVIETWLAHEPRLRASLVVPSRSPADAAAEIRRVGDHPGFVQVLMPVRSHRLYGNRDWHPVYEAMVEHDLVLGMHWGGTSEGAPSPVGWPSWYLEEYAAEQQNYMAQLTSLVAEGVFQVFPSLRVVLLEIGFTWVPSLWWRMEKEWKGLRRDIPWVNRRVIELLREHVRFSIAPIDAGPPEEMAKILEWLGSDELLLFATDYPHRHDDDVGALLALMPEAARARVMAENARELYKL